MTTIAAKPRATTSWLVPGGLLLLAAIPLLGGTIRLITLEARRMRTAGAGGS